MRNQYGYKTRLVRTDHIERPDGPYALRLRVLRMIEAQPMKRAEIARRCGVARCTIGRVIDELSCHHPVVEDDKRRVYVDTE